MWDPDGPADKNQTTDIGDKKQTWLKFGLRGRLCGLRVKNSEILG